MHAHTHVKCSVVSSSSAFGVHHKCNYLVIYSQQTSSDCTKTHKFKLSYTFIFVPSVLNNQPTSYLASYIYGAITAKCYFSIRFLTYHCLFFNETSWCEPGSDSPLKYRENPQNINTGMKLCCVVTIIIDRRVNYMYNL